MSIKTIVQRVRTTSTGITTTNMLLSIMICTLFGCLALMFSKNKSTSEDYSKEKHKVDSLSFTIHNLQQVQLSKDSTITRLKSQELVLKAQIQSDKEKIVKIKKEYGTKIQTAYSYTSTELDSFFTSRYH